MDPLSEIENVKNDLRNLLLNERIRPEPEFQCFLKCLSQSQDFFLPDNEILNLIQSHGVQLRNDVKYWLQKNQFDSKTDKNKPIPVLNLEHLVINDLGDVVKKLKEFPSEWSIIQITKKFAVSNFTEKDESKKVSDIQITRLPCGDLASKVKPYTVTVERDTSQENIFVTLKNLIKNRQTYFSLGRNSKKLREVYSKTNTDLMSFIKELENYFLSEWICLFRGRLQDRKLELETQNKVKELVNAYLVKENRSFKCSERHLDLIHKTVLSAHLMKNKAIFSVLKSVFGGKNDEKVNLSGLMMLVENIKILNLSNSCAIKRAEYDPVILILDNELEIVPWEMISTLSGQPVCRISSLHLLYALFKYHQSHIINGYRILEVDRMYCLINPSKDLDTCEKEMKTFLKQKIPWAEVDVGTAPSPKELVSKFNDISIYLYCGHGTGMQYLEDKELKKSFVRSLMLLFGCSSNIPKNGGGRTPFQNNTYTYITNGCPCVVGCIQDVASNDADLACKEMLSAFIPSATIESGEIVVSEPKEPNILKALSNGKNVCNRYWSKSAFIARGIPCKTAIGDKNMFNFKTN